MSPFGFAHISSDDIFSSLRRGAGALAKNSHLFWKQVSAGKVPTWSRNVVLIVLHSPERRARILNSIRQNNNSSQLVCLSSGPAGSAASRSHRHPAPSAAPWPWAPADPPKNPFQEAARMDFGIPKVSVPCTPRIWHPGNSKKKKKKGGDGERFLRDGGPGQREWIPTGRGKG